MKRQKNIKLCIFKSFNGEHEPYIKACSDLGIEYEIVDLYSSDWLKQVKNSSCDGFLIRPTAFKQYLKDGVDERLYFVANVLKKSIYPSYTEIFIYENKNNMTYWLDSFDIQHAKTNIFYYRKEALNFIKNARFPLVFKSKIGAGGIGVHFIKNKLQAQILIRKVFPIHRNIVIPFVNTGYIRKTSKKRIKFIRLKLRDDRQYGHIMFQEKLGNIKCEWRMIKIGDSYFGHQKLASKEGKHSGSDLVGWIEPPKELLELTKHICDVGNFRSMNIDIFETEDGKYYVNELQSLFGSYNNSQMYIDGKPGRFLNIDGKWVFEEGFFNQNASMNLRVLDFVKILEGKNEN